MGTTARRSWMDERTARRGTGVAIAVAVCLLVFGPVPWLAPDGYSAWAAGLQAAGVLLALAYAAWTLHIDRVERRIDRTKALHDELVSGPVAMARVRLVQLLQSKRDANGHIEATTTDEVRTFVYLDRANERPNDDLTAVLRFFEGVDGARRAGTVAEDLLHSLLGGQAAWWDCVFTDPAGHDRPPLRALHRLADWANDKAEREQTEAWGRSRLADFGRMRRTTP